MNKLGKILILVLLAGSLGGCVASSSASFRTRGSTEAAWQVQGTWNQATDTVKISIDGTQVISGNIGIFSSSKTLNGTYKKHPVMAILTKATNLFGASKMHCTVTIDGEVAANFDW